MERRYSIEVDEEEVEIFGDLTIEEVYDFLSFYERKGYKSVVCGYQNSSLRMMKLDQSEVIVNERIKYLKDEIEDYKRSYKIEQERHEEAKIKLKTVENLLKNLMSEEHKKYKDLYDETQKIIRSTMNMHLGENPEVQRIMDNRFGDFAPKITDLPIDFDCTSQKMEPIPNCCSIPKKQEQYEKLVQLKNDYPHIPVPSPSDFYINPDPTKE